MTTKTIEVKQDIRAEQLAAAQAFRNEMASQGTLVVRLLSSPGSGKTTLLERTAEELSERFKVGVLVGDLETRRDAKRLGRFAPTVQITTGGACHLEIPLILRAMPSLGQDAFEFLFIEDIGNLICPASHDLGEHLRVVLLSTTEGDDKPGKYPKAYRTSDSLIITKTDLLPYVPFVIEYAEKDARLIQPGLDIFSLSASSNEGLQAWFDYLVAERGQLLANQSKPSQEKHARTK